MMDNRKVELKDNSVRPKSMEIGESREPDGNRTRPKREREMMKMMMMTWICIWMWIWNVPYILAYKPSRI